VTTENSEEYSCIRGEKTNLKPRAINTKLQTTCLTGLTKNKKLTTHNQQPITENQRFAKQKNSPKFTLTKN
jgi:hypothetical protein